MHQTFIAFQPGTDPLWIVRRQLGRRYLPPYRANRRHGPFLQHKKACTKLCSRHHLA